MIDYTLVCVVPRFDSNDGSLDSTFGCPDGEFEILAK